MLISQCMSAQPRGTVVRRLTLARLVELLGGEGESFGRLLAHAGVWTLGSHADGRQDGAYPDDTALPNPVFHAAAAILQVGAHPVSQPGNEGAETLDRGAVRRVRAVIQFDELDPAARLDKRHQLLDSVTRLVA